MVRKDLIHEVVGDWFLLQSQFKPLIFNVMKKEWTENELKQVMLTIKNWINSRKFVTRHDGLLGHIRTIQEMDSILGMPYTSSGRAACVGVCNTELYLDDKREYHVYCFEMSDYGVVYAVCHNYEGKELMIPINK